MARWASTAERVVAIAVAVVGVALILAAAALPIGYAFSSSANSGPLVGSCLVLLTVGVALLLMARRVSG